MKRFLFSVAIITLLSFGVSNFSSAQCSLCKSSAETSLKEGNTQAKGLNTGIVYLLAMPYLLVGGIGYYWYVQKKKESKETDGDL